MLVFDNFDLNTCKYMFSVDSIIVSLRFFFDCFEMVCILELVSGLEIR